MPAEARSEESVEILEIRTPAVFALLSDPKGWALSFPEFREDPKFGVATKVLHRRNGFN
jgi:hypothetical protein